MADPAKKPKPWWLGAIFVVVGIAILLVLGTWQLQRLKWKEDLLAHIAALQGAAPAPLADLAGRSPQALDFVRASLDCADLETRPHASVYAIQDGEAGSRWVVACPAPGGRSILVDRGFAGEDETASPGAAQTATVVGVLRQVSKPSWATPANDPARNRWFWRGVPAMAKALNAPDPLPVVLMLESPAPASGAPHPAPLPTEIPNRHLEYALTWYGLAGALAGVYIALLLRRRPSKT
jgi:surfeit locus 1 family protein